MDFSDGSDLALHEESVRVLWQERHIDSWLSTLGRVLTSDEWAELGARVAQVRQFLAAGEVEFAFAAIARLEDETTECGRSGKLFQFRVTLEGLAGSTSASKARYPHLAGWPGSRTCSGAHGGRSVIALGLSCDHGHHRTQYTVVRKPVVTEHTWDIYRAWDAAIKDWQAQQPPDTVKRLMRGWTGEPGWEERYPHIASWLDRGKRHCIRIDIDLVEQRTDTKIWFYNSRSREETVLLDRQMSTVSEHEILPHLEGAISAWVGADGPGWPADE